MKTYLIIYSSYQSIEQADSIEELYFKYPDAVQAIIKLESDTIVDIKELPQ